MHTLCELAYSVIYYNNFKIIDLISTHTLNLFYIVRLFRKVDNRYSLQFAGTLFCIKNTANLIWTPLCCTMLL